MGQLETNSIYLDQERHHKKKIDPSPPSTTIYIVPDINEVGKRRTEFPSIKKKNSNHSMKPTKCFKSCIITFSEKGVKAEKNGKENEERKVIDLEALLREVSDISGARKEELLLGNPSGTPVLALLPGIHSALQTNPATNLRVSPFKPPHAITMGVAIKEVPANEVRLFSFIRPVNL